MSVIYSTHIELKSGMLLSKEILQQMDKQSHLLESLYMSYPDGIIQGFEFEETGGQIYITPGILKYQGNYFCSDENINVTDILNDFDNNENIDSTIYVSLAFVPVQDECKNEGIISKRLKLSLVKKEHIDVEKIVLAEFQYSRGKSGWKPEDKENPINKLKKQLDTTNYHYSFINAKYSMPSENVFSPYIYRLMKESLEKCGKKSTSDGILRMLIAQNKVVSFHALEQWGIMNGFEIDIHDRNDIIDKFVCYCGEKNNEDKTQHLNTTNDGKPVQSKDEIKFGL